MISASNFVMNFPRAILCFPLFANQSIRKAPKGFDLPETISAARRLDFAFRAGHPPSLPYKKGVSLIPRIALIISFTDRHASLVVAIFSPQQHRNAT